jgi:hypothetical protein
MGYFHRENVFLDNLIAIFLLCGIWAIFLFVLWLGTGHTDFSCFRSLEGTECTLNRIYQLSKSSEIKVHNPIAVDIDDYINPDSGTPFITAVIRSRNASSKVTVYSGYNFKDVQAVAKEINEFLLSSNEPSFHKRF